MVAQATKKTVELDGESFDASKARLVRVGPRRSGRLSLRSLREGAGLTQKEVARRSGLTQPEVSKLETAESLDDRQLLTLRRYCAAMGDELELVTVSKLGHRIGIAPPARRLTAVEANASRSKIVCTPLSTAQAQEAVREALRALNKLHFAMTGDLETMADNELRAQRDRQESEAYAVARYAIKSMGGPAMQRGEAPFVPTGEDTATRDASVRKAYDRIAGKLTKRAVGLVLDRATVIQGTSRRRTRSAMRSGRLP